MEMAMPCPKKDVFLAKLASVNLLMPVPRLQHLKKNQLLQPQVLTSFQTKRQYYLYSAPQQARQMFPLQKSASILSEIPPRGTFSYGSQRKFFQLQSTSESIPLSLPKKVFPSSRAPSSLLQRHLNFSRLKYSQSGRFLLLTMRSFNRAGSVGAGGSSRQGLLRVQGRRVRVQSRKKVRGAMLSGLLTVLSSLAGSCSLMRLGISSRISSSCAAVSSLSHRRKHSSSSQLLFPIILLSLRYIYPHSLFLLCLIWVRPDRLPVDIGGAYNNQLGNYQRSDFIIYCFMERQNPFSQELGLAIKPRDFKCPCGKTYLSYAALFTHIKQKHDGKPPGKITKPPSQYDKRGRPPLKPKVEKASEPSPPTEPPQETAFPPETLEERERREMLAQRSVGEVAGLLEGMPQEQLNKAHLNQIEVFSQMSVYLNTRSGPAAMAQGNICIADGFFQFARAVCAQIKWSHFEPFYLLFMLFLQFIIDSESDRRILTEANLDLFCQYINDFLENHLKDMAEYYQLQNLWVFKKENSIRIFFGFFHWCMHKRYVSYRINMAGEAGRGEKQGDGWTSTASQL